MEQTPSNDQELRAHLRATIESYIRSATLSHLRDDVAVRQYIEHQTDTLIENILRSFKVEKK